MSEFADSLHFVGQDLSEVEKLMRRVHAQGAILGSNRRTVSTLVASQQKLQLASHGNVIDYAYAEDHGIWIRFYKEGRLMAKVVIVWDTLGIVEPEEENRAGITDDIAAILIDHAFLAAADASDFTACLATFNPKDWSQREAFVDAMGNFLGLSAFRWVKAEDAVEACAADEEYRESLLADLRDVYPEVVLID